MRIFNSLEDQAGSIKNCKSGSAIEIFVYRARTLEFSIVIIQIESSNKRVTSSQCCILYELNMYYLAAAMVRLTAEEAIHPAHPLAWPSGIVGDDADAPSFDTVAFGPLGL